MNSVKTIPEGFPAIGGWSYERVWKENQEFCQYVLKISNPTNFMKTFQEFCQMKSKNGST
jgi:hypothetical protein